MSFYPIKVPLALELYPVINLCRLTIPDGYVFSACSDTTSWNYMHPTLPASKQPQSRQVDKPPRYMGAGTLLEHPSQHDLTVSVGSKPHIFHLQRCILSKNSEYFDDCPSSIAFPSHDPASMTLLFQWLYTGHIWKSSFKTTNPWIDLSARLFIYACEFNIEGLKSVAMGYCVRSLMYSDYDQGRMQNWRFVDAVASLIEVYKVGKRYVDVFFDSIVRKGRIKDLLGSDKIREVLVAKPEVMVNLMDVVGTVLEERIEYEPYRRL